MADKPNLNELMKQAQEMQAKMQVAQNELADKEVTGEAGAGLVKIIMTGRHDVIKVAIDDEVLQEDKEILEDLIAAAVNDAARKVEAMSQDKLSVLTSSMGMPPTFNPFEK